MVAIAPALTLAFGLLEGGLLIVDAVGFIQSLIPKDPPTDTTVVRIGVGKSADPESEANLGGARPNIRLFDVRGEDLGEAKGSKKKILAGDFYEYKVKMPKDNRGQAEYIALSAGGDDAICLSYVTVTWPGSGGSRVWFGDVGKYCGAKWYHSEIVTGEGDYRPSCTWIDGDATNGAGQGMGIHISDFAVTKERAVQWNETKDLLCNSQPRFHMYPKLNLDHWLPVYDPPLRFDPETGRDADPERVLNHRGVTRGEQPPSEIDVEVKSMQMGGTKSVHAWQPVGVRNRLVKSTHHQQTASELCMSETSAGADFVSLTEGLYCDMSEKELWPLCKEGYTHACFDVEKNKMRQAVGLQGRDTLSGRSVTEKNYEVVEEW